MSLNPVRLVKRLCKKYSRRKSKKKILEKLVLGKEEKGFDVVECRLKDNTIEYLNSFPLGFALVKDVLVSMDRFKRVLVKIVYHPLSKAHVNKIKTHITIYNKFDTRVLIFTIPKDQDKPNFIFPRALKTWEEIMDLQVFIVGGNTQLLQQRWVNLVLRFSIYFF